MCESAANHSFNSCARITRVCFDKNYNQDKLFLNHFGAFFASKIYVGNYVQIYFYFLSLKGKALFSQH